MGSMSITHWLILGLIVLVLFGGSGKISGMMGDLAKGLKTFKKSMAEDDKDAPAASIAHKKEEQDVSMHASAHEEEHAPRSSSKE